MSLFSRRKSKLLSFDNAEIQFNIESYLGKRSDTVLHSVTPFEMGPEAGGGSDVYMYNEIIDGTTYITGDLMGKKQKKSDAGNYELMICHRSDNEWGSQLISQLAYYTLQASLLSGETMNIGPFAKNDISAVIFEKFFEFEVAENKYGLMLLIGITNDEVAWAKEHSGQELMEKLKAHEVYPFTDFERKSVV